ncbi:MAG: histidine kinase [Fluviicola sp.]
MRFWLVLFSCAVMFPLFAQRGVIHLTGEDGLIDNRVRDMVHDDRGFLWIATANGLDRFDGQRFLHFQSVEGDPTTISSNDVVAIAADAQQRIWVATQNKGLCWIDSRTFHIHRIGAKQGIPGKEITALTRDASGNIWCGVRNKGLFRFDPKSKRFEKIVLNNGSNQVPTITQVFQDKFFPEYLWATTENGLYRIHRPTKKATHYIPNKRNVLNPQELAATDHTIYSIEQDGKGNLYLGLDKGEFLYFDHQQDVFKKVPGPFFIPEGDRKRIVDLKWRDTRYLYVCLEDSEFLLFDARSKSFVRYAEAERSIFNASCIVRNGSQIAVGSKTMGCYVHDERLIFGDRMPETTPVNGLYWFNDYNVMAKWYRQENNLLVWANGAQRLETSMAANEEILASGIYGWNPLVIGKQAAYAWEQGKVKVINGSWGQLQALSACIQVNSCWIGTANKGVYRLLWPENQRVQALPGTADLERIQALGSWKQYLLVGHRDGLTVINTLTNKRDKRLLKLEIGDQVQALFIDAKQRLWVGTLHDGVYVYDLKKNRMIKRFTIRNGLQDENVGKIVQDKLGRVWVLNPGSISIFDKQLRSLFTLEKKHGMGEVVSVVPAGDYLFFLEEKGFITSRLRAPFPPVVAPQPYIQRLLVLNSENAGMNLTSMDYDQNDVRIEFGVLDFANGTNNLVAYRLKGLQDEWQRGNGRDEVDYYNLSGGKYVFELRIRKDGIESIARYPFEVAPPIWLRWWFIVMVIVILFLSIRAYLRLRIKRIEQEQEVKAQFNAQLIEMEAKALRAQMNPHFLFNSLNSIRLFVLKNDTDSASNYMAKFSKLLRMILNHSRQDMITVYDEMQSLKLYLEFERLRFDKGFDFDLQIDGQEVLDCQIPPMIIQPFVENAIWHGLMPREDDQGHLHVAFRKEPGRLVVEVRDNGIGRERSKHNNAKRSLKEGSVGLQITKDRLKALSKRTGRENDFEITDCYDENQQPMGTLVILTFETETL